MSSDSDAKLIRMANQIATFFDTQPNADNVEATARHLTDFWDPRMRARLLDLLEQGAPGLSETARAAALRLDQRQDA